MDFNVFQVIMVVLGLIGINITISISKIYLFNFKIKRIQNISKIKANLINRKINKNIKYRKIKVMTEMKKEYIYNINNIHKPKNNPKEDTKKETIKNDLPPKNNQIVYDMKRDMEFLESTIMEKCKSYIALELSDFIEDQDAMASESLLKESVSIIGKNVYNTFSETYLDRLYCYIDKKELPNYIFEKIFTTISPIILGKHKNNLKKF